jgi:hypothetical protein
MRTTPSLDPKMSLQPPAVLYLSWTTIFFGFGSSSGSGGASSPLLFGLAGACGGAGLGLMPKAGELKGVPDHSEIAATQGAK